MHENALYHGQAGFLLEYCDRGDLINVIKPITNFKICNSYLSGHKACDANSTACLLYTSDAADECVNV